MNGRGNRFAPGDTVRVVLRRAAGNPRTPDYVKGRMGVVTASHGIIVNPLDHHLPYPPLYSVAFPVENSTGSAGPDLLIADLHEEWLEPV